MIRFKQPLLREGRGCGNKGQTVKINNSVALGQGTGSSSMDIFLYITIFLAILQIMKSPLDAHRHVLRRLMMLTPTYLTTNQSEECPQANYVLFEALL